ncbi:MAG: hypothetical protein F2667_12210 [Actinobacteria bacterium]|uniref:Unannotated protein n=1 Tax=freshwater metagenome TaxID=449393 RepID=A0A6J6RVH6_9ZZZZ|nr:hypothetical protein [Actinomycetota bacterium]
MIFTIALGSFHTVHLDPVVGNGLMVCPRPQDDVRLDGASVHRAAWRDAVEGLARMGWAPWQHGRVPGIVHEGVTAAGDPVLALYAVQPMLAAPSDSHLADAWRELCEASGLIGSTLPRAGWLSLR